MKKNFVSAKTILSILYGLVLFGAIAVTLNYYFTQSFWSLQSFDRGFSTTAMPELEDKSTTDVNGKVQIIDSFQGMQSQQQLAVADVNKAQVKTAAIREAVTMAAGPPCDVVDCANTGMPFTVAGGGPPGQVTLVSPIGNITNQNPTFVWTETSNVDEYQLVINDQSTSTTIHNVKYAVGSVSCSNGNCSITPSNLGLTTSTTYRWWIRAWNSTGKGPWSSGVNFVIGTAGVPPGQVTLVSPIGNITNQNPTFVWTETSNVDEYQLVINDQSAAATIHNVKYAAGSVSCSSGNCSITPSSLGLTTSTTYRWWIRAWNSSGKGPWSSGSNFMITSVSAASISVKDESLLDNHIFLPFLVSQDSSFSVDEVIIYDNLVTPDEFLYPDVPFED